MKTRQCQYCDEYKNVEFLPQFLGDDKTCLDCKTKFEKGETVYSGWKRHYSEGYQGWSDGMFTPMCRHSDDLIDSIVKLSTKNKYTIEDLDEEQKRDIHRTLWGKWLHFEPGECFPFFSRKKYKGKPEALFYNYCWACGCHDFHKDDEFERMFIIFRTLIRLQFMSFPFVCYDLLKFKDGTSLNINTRPATSLEH